MADRGRFGLERGKGVCAKERKVESGKNLVTS